MSGARQNYIPDGDWVEGFCILDNRASYEHNLTVSIYGVRFSYQNE